jgi:hypothetical protein
VIHGFLAVVHVPSSMAHLPHWLRPSSPEKNCIARCTNGTLVVCRRHSVALWHPPKFFWFIATRESNRCLRSSENATVGSDREKFVGSDRERFLINCRWSLPSSDPPSFLSPASLSPQVSLSPLPPNMDLKKSEVRSDAIRNQIV